MTRAHVVNEGRAGDSAPSAGDTRLQGEGAGRAGEPRWLEGNEDHAWRSFLAMQALLRRALGKELQAATGLSEADYAVLVHLSEAPDGRLRPFELGMAADWEKSRLSHHLSRMERRGLVERQLCPSDSRGAVIALTPTGRTAIELAAPFHVEQVRRLFLSSMSEGDLATLTRICDSILSQLGTPGAELCTELAAACGEGDDGED